MFRKVYIIKNHAQENGISIGPSKLCLGPESEPIRPWLIRQTDGATALQLCSCSLPLCVGFV